MNEKSEIPIKEEKKEDIKEDEKEDKDKNKDDDLKNLGEKYIEGDENIISTNEKQEDNKNKDNTENKKEPIIEEIDTTVPKEVLQNDENNNLGQEPNFKEDRINIVIKNSNPNTICHRLIPKGLDIDITNKVFFKCYKIKTKSNVISFITGSKKVKIPYLIFLDENFYYMVKDKQVNENNENIRRIGNRYDLSKISNFQTRKVDEDYEFAFEFMYEDYFDRIYKLLYFEKKDAELFLEVFLQMANNLGLDIQGNIMDFGEEEEEEEDGEEENEGEDKEENAGEENEEEEDEKEETDEKEEGKKDEKEEDKEIGGNIENEKDEINKENKKEDTEINSTKEESKEIREVEIGSEL